MFDRAHLNRPRAYRTRIESGKLSLIVFHDTHTYMNRRLIDTLMGTPQECNRLEMPSIYRQVSMFTWEEEKNGAIFRNPSGRHGPEPMFTDISYLCAYP